VISLQSIVNFFEYSIIFYVAVISAIYFLLMTMGYFALRHSANQFKRSDLNALLKSSMLPAISVLAPAYNESATIRDSVRAMLKLHYPNHEVIVINDGSKDDTLEILIEEFRLYKSTRKPAATIPTRSVKAIYESRDPIRLIVVDKENGGKADSLNAGLNVARTPLVSAVDSDSLLEPDALLLAVKPFPVAASSASSMAAKSTRAESHASPRPLPCWRAFRRSNTCAPSSAAGSPSVSSMPC
jgi:cellulose synthase/poly-beta-1,6-N-acetylglucosamine synthase-like glycosyltransferase